MDAKISLSLRLGFTTNSVTPSLQPSLRWGAKSPAEVNWHSSTEGDEEQKIWLTVVNFPEEAQMSYSSPAKHSSPLASSDPAAH